MSPAQAPSSGARPAQLPGAPGCTAGRVCRQRGGGRPPFPCCADTAGDLYAHHTATPARASSGRGPCCFAPSSPGLRGSWFWEGQAQRAWTLLPCACLCPCLCAHCHPCPTSCTAAPPHVCVPVLGQRVPAAPEGFIGRSPVLCDVPPPPRCSPAPLHLARLPRRVADGVMSWGSAAGAFGRAAGSGVHQHWQVRNAAAPSVLLPGGSPFPGGHEWGRVPSFLQVSPFLQPGHPGSQALGREGRVPWALPSAAV